MPRDSKGRFVKQPPVSQETIRAICSDEKVEQALDALHRAALKGDVRAIDLYLAYAVGKPGPASAAQDGDSIQTWKELVEQILNEEEDVETGAE